MAWQGFTDELAWGAAWLYAATNQTSYLDDAKVSCLRVPCQMCPCVQSMCMCANICALVINKDLIDHLHAWARERQRGGWDNACMCVHTSNMYA